ncbi:T6SS amidase immunity protein Tai4 family protein [Hydrogenophaga palleronii]|uniref:T6SS amidase immunity protein Tai4 family protein n=1 Tax=Hydrogenophaga palleronii TaxID=65655 RepID=UPI000826BC89|nr:T6SS amidase immunity protein Tai4 family protein [Hydrogenophaga palleronii]
MKASGQFIVAMLGFVIAGAAVAADAVTAVQRTNAENFKDRALGVCLSTAYEGSPAGLDARTTSSVFLDWTYYDFEKANPAVERLAEAYLRRDYANPVEGYAGAEFKLLKCLDMRHSKELDGLMRQHVPHPAWVGDRPAKRRAEKR